MVRQAASAKASRSGAGLRTFLCEDGFKNTAYEGKRGFQLKVRLPDYRSLPLSCIAGIELRMDGEAINSKDIVFRLNGYSHKLEELPGLHQVWWFILDPAELFVARERDLTAGEHEVEGTVALVTPYATVGVHTRHVTAKKRLLLESTL